MISKGDEYRETRERAEDGGRTYDVGADLPAGDLVVNDHDGSEKRVFLQDITSKGIGENDG